MNDPESWLSQIMDDMGTTALIPSDENAKESVWITDDDAPGGVAGYYEKRLVPLVHHFIKDGRVFAFDFEREGTRYRIQSGKAETRPANVQRVAEVIETLFQWIENGITTWDEAFAGFVRTSTSTSTSNEWWCVLRAPPDATRDEIEHAYRRQARVVHPDMGGDAESFRKLRAAYEQALTSLD